MTDDCQHEWRLTETGYIRTWHTEFDETEKTIHAYFTDSSDFSDMGAEDDHLECSLCLEQKPIPDGWEVEFS